MGELTVALAIVGASALATVLAQGWLGTAQTGAQGPNGTLRVLTSGDDSELVKTVPISRRKATRSRVAMSVGPRQLGEVRAGDRVEASSEVEVSVCLKPNENHGSDRKCVGRMYGYDPAVTAQLVLTSSAQATSGTWLGRQKITCRQKQPNRNHHCVIAFTGALSVEDTRSLPCPASACYVNLVLSARDKKAKRGQRIVVGAASSGKVKGDKGRLNVVRYRPGDVARPQPLTTSSPLRKRLPIAGEGREPKTKSIYSVALRDLRAGEQLVIEGRVASRIGRHPYNAFQTTNVLLSERPTSTSRKGWPTRVADFNGQATEGNGFNCTQGRSAHPDPCTARKLGVLRITRDSPQTLYLNLVAGMAAQADFKDRHRGSDKARILKRGFLRVYRYPPSRNDARTWD